MQRNLCDAEVWCFRSDGIQTTTPDSNTWDLSPCSYQTRTFTNRDIRSPHSSNCCLSSSSLFWPSPNIFAQEHSASGRFVPTRHSMRLQVCRSAVRGQDTRALARCVFKVHSSQHNVWPWSTCSRHLQCVKQQGWSARRAEVTSSQLPALSWAFMPAAERTAAKVPIYLGFQLWRQPAIPHFEYAHTTHLPITKRNTLK